MKAPAVPCAIYTRKSSEEGLEQDFNSLDAQREACEAYILSQREMGWTASRATYDDGGFSGGNTERPALKRLMADIAAGKVRVVVVYKVDRLTRSLADFARLVEQFDAHGVSFVSVTQQFNTTSSMGRLTLNVLLSFAQFEREVTGERIRDKIAASKRKGMWMGGVPPVGYIAKNRTLVIDPKQADRVREIFQLYLKLNCVRKLKAELDRRGWVTPPRVSRRKNASGGRPFARGHLYKLLSNPIYIGRIAHKKETFPGSHPAIINLGLWRGVQRRLAENCQGHRTRARANHRSLLCGLLYDPQGNPLSPSHATKGQKPYRYYVGSRSENGKPGSTIRIPAHELEEAVIQALSSVLTDESRLLKLLGKLPARDAREGLQHAKALATRLSEAPSDALARLVKRIVVSPEKMELSINDAAFRSNAKPADGKDALLRVPLQVRRSGMAVRVISASAARKRAPSAQLIRLLTKAHDWAGRLTSGEANGILAIAKAERVTSSWVNRHVHLAFLAPDIVRAIAHGEQPEDLYAKRLMSAAPLPLGWGRQREQFGHLMQGGLNLRLTGDDSLPSRPRTA